MPIVSPSNVTVVKFSLPSELVDELDRYSEWSQASKVKVVRTALKRLFEQDEEWKDMTDRGEAGLKERE